MGMPLSTTAPSPKSRRALLVGALGGLGAWAASTIGRATPVRADGETVVVGGLYFNAISETRIQNNNNNATALVGVNNQGGRGLHGFSSTGEGVSGGGGLRGVAGFSSTGVGLYGQSAQGLALQTLGRAKFSTSGVATILAGSTGKTVNPGVNVTNGSFVLLTPKVNLGSRALWFTTNPSGDTFRIRMSSARSSGTKVAWLLLG
jgi:hypothetical protein